MRNKATSADHSRAIADIVVGIPPRVRGEREIDYLARLSSGGGMFAEDEIPAAEFVERWRLGADYCYFMFDIVGRGIKIGRARSPSERRSRLSSSGACDLVILAVVRNGDIEGLYHNAFRHAHIGGEWFEPHPDILAEIERLTQDDRHND